MNTSQLPTVRLGSGAAATRPTRLTSQAPLVLGRYRLIRRLGGGGFGTVFAARDERLERDVAVKVLPRERIVGGRFEREARAAARLAHPAIVTLYEAAVDDEGAYLVSELVRGRTFGELLHGGRLSDRHILAIAASVCDALEHAHQQGVIHRDVKPSNVLVPARPSVPGHSAKLTDFGVARVVGGDSLTRTGDVVGTLSYMAPEQAEGRQVGPPADLYSLAVLVYEALTGVNPLRDLRAAGAGRRLGTYLPPLRRQRRDLPRALGIAIDQALRPRPSERGSLAELRVALTATLPEAGEAPGIVRAGWGGPETSEEAPFQDRQAEAPAARAASQPRGGTEDSVDVDPIGAAAWRGLGALAAGASATWLSVHTLATSPLAPLAIGLVVTAAVLFLPRLGFVAAMLLLGGFALAGGHPGGALAVWALAALTMLALPRFAVGWALPAGAVGLALIGLAGAWPAVVGGARLRWWQRGALGGLGFLWLATAGALAPPPAWATNPPLPRPAIWTSSLQSTWHAVLVPLVRSGLFGGCLVWAGAAIVLPWMLGDRRRYRAIVMVAAWAGATVTALGMTGVTSLGGVVLGVVAGAVWLAAPALVELTRRTLDRAGSAPRVP